jgi:hypothetical protein
VALRLPRAGAGDLMAWVRPASVGGADGFRRAIGAVAGGDRRPAAAGAAGCSRHRNGQGIPARFHMRVTVRIAAISA